MVKIFIDPGHGGRDGGASFGGLVEKDLTLKMSKKIRDQLKGYKDVEVRLSRTTDKYVGLKERARLANQWGADYFLSIHINAGGGTGYESFVYNETKNKGTRKLRKVIHGEVVNKINVTDRGRKQKNLSVLRNTSMSAMLSENLFIDHDEDARKLKKDSFLDDLASGHVKGLVKAFNLVRGSKTKQESKNKNKASKSKVNKTASYTGNSIVDYLKRKNIDHSKANRKKLAKEYGVKGYDYSAKKNTELLNAMRKGKPKSSSNKSSYVGKRVESKVNGLRFYNKLSWSDKDVVGHVNRGIGFPTIVSKHKVGKGHQYKVKNSKGHVYYITASNKYVNVK